MSAPNAGRQSPPPEEQSDKQQAATPAGSGKVSHIHTGLLPSGTLMGRTL